MYTQLDIPQLSNENVRIQATPLRYNKPPTSANGFSRLILDGFTGKDKQAYKSGF